jgi:methylated-DNA-protein-cysteine methyltransferase-like protein
MQLLQRVPSGRVTTVEALAENLGEPAALVRSRLSQLTEDERDLVPWHRVVAKGGAIGRGPHRDQQFARLAREGVLVSPAGIVHDLPRFAVTTFSGALENNAAASGKPTVAPAMLSRSRGMKSHT